MRRPAELPEVLPRSLLPPVPPAALAPALKYMAEGRLCLFAGEAAECASWAFGEEGSAAWRIC